LNLIRFIPAKGQDAHGEFHLSGKADRGAVWLALGAILCFFGYVR